MRVRRAKVERQWCEVWGKEGQARSYLPYPLPFDDDPRSVRALEMLCHLIARNLQGQLPPSAGIPNPVWKSGPFDAVAAELTCLIHSVSPEKTDASRHRGSIFGIRASTTHIRRKTWR